MSRQRYWSRFALSFCLTASVALLATAQQTVEHTKDSVDDIKKALADKKAVFVDVREKNEWDKGHLKDAQFLPLSDLKKKISAEELKKALPADKVVYLHCASGIRCLTAAEILKKEGFEVRPLKQGYKELLKLGFPPDAK